MNLDRIRSESSRFSHDFKIPNLNDTPDDPSISILIDSDIPQETPDAPPTIRIAEQLEEQKLKIFLIEKALKKISDRGLSGREHVEQYLRSLYRRNCRPNTFRGNITAVTHWLVFLKEHRGTCLEAVTREDLSALIEHWQDRGLAPVSVSTWLRTLYAFSGFLVERDVIGPDLVKRKMRIKVPESLPRAIDPDDVKKLLSVIRKIRDRAMILVLLRTGMRIGELLGTKMKEVNLKEKKIEIFEAPKNRVGRVVFLSDDALPALKKWLKERAPDKDYLFYSQRRNTLAYTSARMMFVKYLEKAGLEEKGYTLHCLRHTFASELLNAGMRLECLQQLLGHSSIEMTRRYARLTDNTRREEYFRAMAIIEKGEIHGHYRFDPAVP